MSRFHAPLSFVLSLCAAAPAGAATFNFSPVSFDFGDVAVGDTAASQTVTVTNTSSTAQVVNLSGGAAGVFGGTTNCAGATLPPGASCTVAYSFAPTTPGQADGTTTFTVGGQTASLSFKGNAISPYTVTARALDFGTVAVGTTAAAQSVVITNTANSPHTLSLAGGAAGVFGGTTNCSGATLAAGASCQISYAFGPTATGDGSTTTSFSIDGMSYGITLTGTGGDTPATPFRVTNTTMDFGAVHLGETAAPQSVIITNISGTAQALSIAGGAAGLFGGTTNCGVATLDAGASCVVSYAFSPTAPGAVTQATSLTLNGKNYAFDFLGQGLSPFLVSPLGFDFGDVALGGTSTVQSVLIRNISSVAQTLSLAGGAAGLFGGTTDCSIASLLPDQSCRVSYAFTPGALGPLSGTTSLTLNGRNYGFSFTGNGVEYVAPSPVPLPPAMALSLGALALLGGWRRRAA